MLKQSISRIMSICALKIMISIFSCMGYVTTANADFIHYIHGIYHHAITGYDGVVPSYLEVPGNITTIYGFADCSTLNTLRITGSHKIGNAAFQNCKNLREVQFPNGFVAYGNWPTIEENAFDGCDNLRTLKIYFDGGNGSMKWPYSSGINSASASLKKIFRILLLGTA